MRLSFTIVSVLLVLDLTEAAEVGRDPGLQSGFETTVRPFLEGYCFGCHNQEKQKGKLDLTIYSSVDAVVRDYRRWDVVLGKLGEEEMPPEEAKKHPPAKESQAVIDWIKALRGDEARRRAGDPGPVLARRLSNAEYDYSIRDLTGVDLRPTREFPIDPANTAGFDNSGESLTMSSALLEKYLAAARLVSDHIVFKPEGFVFAPHPMVSDSDRDKYCVQRVVDFYDRHQVDYAEYFFACWRYRHRQALGAGELTLDQVADGAGLSARYLATVWTLLQGEDAGAGPLSRLRVLWRSLPAPSGGEDGGVRSGCEAMRDFVETKRGELVPSVQPIRVKGMSSGAQPFALWSDRQQAANRRRHSGEQNEELDRFCAVFPDAFHVSSRSTYEGSNPSDGVRWLSAGFHLMHGYFRDDGPLYELILDDEERVELDRLWEELNCITRSPMRQYKDFVFFERAEPPRFMIGAQFDFARSEDKDVTSEEKLGRLASLYLERAREIGAGEVALEAIDEYFRQTASRVRWVERTRAAAEPSHLESLQRFAERAWRRPLSKGETGELLDFYRSLRSDGLDHEESVRDVVASVLVSPRFCYLADMRMPQEPSTGHKTQIANRKGDLGEAEEGAGVRPLNGYELASRLSYFIWSSLPDARLLEHAAAGDLRHQEVLRGEVRRLLDDERVLGLATEFGGHWLDFRRFQNHNSVDRERFKMFDNALREAMFEEPIRFFVDLARSDGSILDFLYGRHTFANRELARHYGIEGLSLGDGEWVRVEDAGRFERGGLLPMSVFLTKNAPGLRTSPVQRGYWVIRRLLGEEVPPPPAEVPDLPDDEAKAGDLTLRQLLARHRENRSCAGCHDRFDAIGLAFEGYGPVGERRDVDLGGRPVDAHAVFPDGSEGTGLEGLRRYLRGRRQEEFIDNLCRKMLAYGLGRGLMLSDEPLIEEMKANLPGDGYRLSGLVEAVVTSRQFLFKRVRED